MALVLATMSPGEPEIFESIQGEGRSIGQPCTFVRLSRCNLACVWCDTAYTWHFDGDKRPHTDGKTFVRDANQVILGEQDVAERIAALGHNRVVITGGEPLLQSAALSGMLSNLRAIMPGLVAEVETNGTLTPTPALDSMIAQYNVSPKLSHSGNAESLALASITDWASHPRAWFKFVIASKADFHEALSLIRDHGIARERVFLMAEGRDSQTILSRAKWLIPLCLEANLAYSDRLHIHLFGDTRGT